MSDAEEVRPRVFRLDVDDRHNITSASEFGDITPLVHEHLSIYSANYAIGRIRKSLLRLDFDPERDFIIIAGGLVLAACLLTACAYQYNRIKVLIFDPRKRVYAEQIIEMEPEL